jgi:hypothetical protein
MADPAGMENEVVVLDGPPAPAAALTPVPDVAPLENALKRPAEEDADGPDAKRIHTEPEPAATG